MIGKRNIAVLLGGPSAEREVSLRSGAAVAGALRSLGHRVFEIDPADGTFTLPPNVEVAVLALHGTYGEDGGVQQQLEELGVPYSGCGIESSRLSFDKVRSKQRFQAAGIPTPRFEVMDSPTAPWPEGWTPPAVLKPVCQGSSVGLQIVHSQAEWAAALTTCLQNDSQALLEEMIHGRECTVGILGSEALPIVEVRPQDGVYDYGSKYTVGRTAYLCPAPFPTQTTKRIQAVALRAFCAVEGRDYGRVDVMVDADGAPWVLEINTLPGMTETSLLPKGAAAAGISYAELCQRMVEFALMRQASRVTAQDQQKPASSAS